MYTSTFIRRHILRLPEGAIFSTREVLNYGRRSAVDQCLHRLVKTSRIIRLAWGLFMKNDVGASRPSPLTVATEKARAFGRQIVIEPADAAKFLNLTGIGNQKVTYATQGHSSSFRYGSIIIFLKGICPRKMAIGDGPVGLAIKALWRLGKNMCDQQTVARATIKFNRQDRCQFKQSYHLMPAWMTEILQNWNTAGT